VTVRVVDQPNKVTVTEEVVTVQVASVGVQGPQGPQGVQGVQGVQGEQGVQGVPGDAATVNVGTTSTLAPGSSATVANSGTTSAAVFDFGIPEGVQGPPGLDGTGAPVFGQVAKMDAGTITIGTQGVYQSTGLTAVLDGENAGISLGTSDLFAVKNTSGATRRLKISASYDASMAGPAKVLGLALAVNGVVDLDTECRATTGLQGAIAKLATAWIIDLADGDEVALYVANHSSTVDIDFQRGRIVATSVAGFGPQGVQGDQGIQGVQGPSGQWDTAQDVDTKTADYTLVTADAGRLIIVDSATDEDVTVDGSLDLAVGQRIDLLRLGTGEVTVVPSGATVNGTPGLKLRARYSAATVLCVGADSYVLVGDVRA
jgi:hypothetical protein